MRKHQQRSALAAVGGLIASLALLLSGTVAANAADQPTVDQTTGNLHITKLETPPGGPTASDGTQNLPAGATVVEGVQFKATKLDGIDLSTNDGWLKAATVTLNANGDPVLPSGVTLDEANAKTGTTDPSGVVDFLALPIGVYYVQELSAPDGVTKAAPFLVTIPITDPTNKNKWNYDVYVYPKNSVVDIVKTVNDSAPYSSPDTQRISYQISADVPRNPGPIVAGNPTIANPTKFVVEDQLDPRLSTPAVTVSLKDAGSVTLTAGTDYTADTAGGKVTVTFTDPAGLAKLGQAATANANAKVIVEISADVAKTASGTISNTATVYPDKDSTGLTSKPVDSKWSSLTVTKTKQDGTTALAGAQFKVYLVKADATAGSAIGAVRSAAVSSGPDGEVTITGLRVSNFANGEAANAGIKANPADATFTVLNPNYIVYWLTETVAPEGYELLAQPIPVQVLSDGSVQQVQVDSNGNVIFDSATGVAKTVGTGTLVIKNVPKNAGFTLPLTGGTGTVMLTVGGVALLGLVLIVARRRRAGEVA